MTLRNITLASAALAITAALGAVLPASADILISQSNMGSQSSGNAQMQDPNRPDATSDPDALEIPRDQRDAPPPAVDPSVGESSTNNRGDSSMSDRFNSGERQAVRLSDAYLLQDPNRPDATSDPALLLLPRDQRDAPPTNPSPEAMRQAGIYRDSTNAEAIRRSGVRQEARQDTTRDSYIQTPNSSNMMRTPSSSGTMQDPNRPDATSDPASLDAPRDQRDAPPTSPAQPLSR